MLKTRETRVEERKEEKRSEKRDRILRAAEAIFLDKGFHAASMNEIAEAADVSTPHLYNFYASKAALALAVQLKMGQETFDALKTAMSAGKKNPSCESIFDSRRSSLMLTILTECTRNPDIKEKITENGARLRAMISEAGGISQGSIPHSLCDGHVSGDVDFQHLYAGREPRADDEDFGTG